MGVHRLHTWSVPPNSIVMGNYTSRLPWQRALQEDIDLWRVYQLLYYREQCGGNAVQIKAIKKHNISAATQRRVAEDNIAIQVYIHMCGAIYTTVHQLLFEQEVKELFEDNCSGKFSRFELSVNPSVVMDSSPIPGNNTRYGNETVYLWFIGRS